ncbi:MAG: OmpA family protein [Kofleriaceae bacterium]|nr:OmpA family protein [Kofleriaceae bacterium]
MNRFTNLAVSALLLGLVACASNKPVATSPSAVTPSAHANANANADANPDNDTSTVVAALPEGSNTAATAPSRPPVATSFTLDGNALTLPSGFFFAAGGAILNEGASNAALWFLVDYLEAKSYISTLRIEGHTSDAGAAAQTLTEQRALAIATWLVAHGIPCERLIAVGFGDTKPVADNSTTEGKAQNRRFTVINAALRGRAIGGMPLDGGGQTAGAVCK